MLLGLSLEMRLIAGETSGLVGLRILVIDDLARRRPDNLVRDCLY
jgi:hypothetical protein